MKKMKLILNKKESTKLKNEEHFAGKDGKLSRQGGFTQKFGALKLTTNSNTLIYILERL